MTSRLDKLERRGLVRRAPNPDDRRSLDVELTAEGREVVDGLVAGHVEREEQMLSALSARECDQLTRILKKLVEHLEVR